MGRRRRIRQHVNPLAAAYLRPRAGPVRRPSHLAPDCRVEVELGCADAQFAFDLARAHPRWLVVGLDIREAAIERNRARAAREQLHNLVFGYVNLNVDLHAVFEGASVDRFHLLFPDPWFKRRHQKRRVIDLEVASVLRHQLRPGGELHVASDIFDLALQAMAELEHPEAEYLGFANLVAPWSFARTPPIAATSKREDTTLARGQRVWRVRYGAGASASAVGRGRTSGRAQQRS